jgi:translation elongation factor aEF-1 beta
MGEVRITIKIMPESVNENLESIKKMAFEVISKNHGKILESKEEPVAFGLKALIIIFLLDESIELDPTEQSLQKIDGISSVEVIEMNRAL